MGWMVFFYTISCGLVSAHAIDRPNVLLRLVYDLDRRSEQLSEEALTWIQSPTKRL